MHRQQLQIFHEYEPFFVINFAAESHVDRSITSPKIFFENNVIGTLNIFEACRRYFQELSRKQKNNFKILLVNCSSKSVLFFVMLTVSCLNLAPKI